MDRYYKENNTRSKRNKNLYGDIYSEAKYTNIEGIASIDNANEIDITKIKEMLQNRENYQKTRQYRKLTEEPEIREVKETPKTEVTEEPSYDIRDILNKARENKKPDDKERVLKNTSYDVLKDLNLKKEAVEDDLKEEDELKELIHTITNTSMLNKMGNNELATDFLKDLTGEDTSVGELNDVKKIIAEEENQKTHTMDNSFFTSSLKLSKKDFDDGEKPSKHIFTKIIIILLILVIIGAIVFMVMN